MLKDLYQQALDSYQKGDLSQASALIEKIIQRGEPHSPTLLLLGRVYEKLGKDENSLQCFETLLNHNPNDFEGRISQATLLYRLKRYSQAMEALKKVLHHDPQHYPSLFMLANCFKATQDFPQAVKTYYQLLHYQPSYASAHLNLANCLSESSYSQDALYHYQKALEIDPHHKLAQKAFSLFAAKILEKTLSEKGYRVYLQALSKLKQAFINPQVFIYALTHVLMVHQHFQEAFRIYTLRIPLEVRKQLGISLPEKGFPKDMNGKTIHIVEEENIETVFFFLRFLREVKSRGAKVHIQVGENEALFFKKLHIFDEVISSKEEFSQAFDYKVGIGDLPFLLDIHTLQSLPPPIPLLPNSEELKIVRYELENMGQGPFVGIHLKEGEDAILEKLLPFLQKQNAHFILIADHPESKIAKKYTQKLPLSHDFSKCQSDYPRLLALIFLLDNYLGFPHIYAHLRASFSKEFSLFIPYPTHWFWQLQEQHLLWYPKGRGYFQDKNQSWDPCLNYYQKQQERP